MAYPYLTRVGTPNPIHTGRMAVGDRVAYSVAFLRNTGQTRGEAPRARGVVTGFVCLGRKDETDIRETDWDPKGRGVTILAEVTWDRPGFPDRVNWLNLTRVKMIGADSALNT